MPVRPCRKEGKPGFTACGDPSCKCYTGANARQEAEKQLRAIERSKAESEGRRLL